MNTAIAITAIICTFLLAVVIVTAIRDTAQTKRCPNCKHTSKETNA